MESGISRPLNVGGLGDPPANHRGRRPEAVAGADAIRVQSGLSLPASPCPPAMRRSQR